MQSLRRNKLAAPISPATAPSMSSWRLLRRQWPHYVALTRLDRPIGIFLLLWPTWWALLIAGGGRPDAWITVVFTLGVVLMRSAGCVINDFADRGFDGRVRRTRARPLAAGAVRPREALILCLVLCTAAFALVLTTNLYTILLSFAGVLLAATYPFAKRYTYLPQFHLGLAFGWGIPMAFAAQTDSVPPTAWLLLIANVLWSVVYDTMYAMVDREDDIRIGVKSTAILFGDADRFIIGVLQVSMLGTLWLLGANLDLRWPFHAGLAVTAALFAYHQYLIRGRDPEGCFRAFLHNNWAGMAIFAGLLASYLLR
ncbi:MAG: 4-hydroxybenzoate octaprenyltransferase [Gammaproteobacteria bacterium]|nr:4-hydroxybenzoate octaprenyltransferase [Gammaproteobacteria bacterium]